MKIGFKFQSLGKISNISAAHSRPVILGQFQHWPETISGYLTACQPRDGCMLPLLLLWLNWSDDGTLHIHSVRTVAFHPRGLPFNSRIASLSLSSCRIPTGCLTQSASAGLIHGLGWVGSGSRICIFSELGWVMGLKWQIRLNLFVGGFLQGSYDDRLHVYCCW